MSECGVTGCGIPDNHGHGSSSGVTVECSGCAILRAEIERLRAALQKVQDKAYDGQNYDAKHALNVLLSIHTLTRVALRGEGEK